MHIPIITLNLGPYSQITSFNAFQSTSSPLDQTTRRPPTDTFESFMIYLNSMKEVGLNQVLTVTDLNYCNSQHAQKDERSTRHQAHRRLGHGFDTTQRQRVRQAQADGVRLVQHWWGQR